MDTEGALITGGDLRLSYRRIGSGRLGDVHELFDKHDSKIFARKVIRAADTYAKSTVEKEARVVSALLKNGGNQNIVSMFDHGWLNSSHYFIDMEICNFSLRDYINYLYGKVSAQPLTFEQHCGIEIVKYDCDAAQKVRNVWAVGVHIALGLEFMHAHKYVHRDLKPENVLYSREQRLWKVADFGLSVEGMSAAAKDTDDSGGTTSYRAPELLAEQASFTSKVDIWALGCVLYELATGKLAFHQDWAVREYTFAPAELTVEVPTLRGFLQYHLSKNIHHLLSKYWRDRPSALEVCLILRSYLRVWDLSIDRLVLDSREYPLYEQWKELAMNDLTESEFLSYLANLYKERGNQTIAIAFRDVVPDPASNSNGATFRIGILEKYLDTGSYDAAVRATRTAIENDPFNIKLWHMLCMAYLGMEDIDGALVACGTTITKSPQNLAPTIALCNVHAARGNYEAAIGRYMEFVEAKDISFLWDQLSKAPHNLAALKSEKSNNEIPSRAPNSSPHSGKRPLSTSAALLRRQYRLPTSFHMMAWTGDVKLLREFIRETDESALTIQEAGYTALHLAVWNMHAEAVNLLLDATKQWLNVPIRIGWTPIHPLHLAVYNNDAEMITCLLNAGADAAAQDKNGLAPIHWAASEGYVASIRALRQGGVHRLSPTADGLTPIHRAAAFGHVPALNALIENVEDVLVRSDNGSMAIHWAAANGQVNALKVLIQWGADIAAKENPGWTPLHRTVSYGRVDAFLTLIEAGADIAAVDNAGFTPLHEAVSKGHTHMLRDLLKANADLEAQDNSGMTPLHQAIAQNHYKMSKALLENGADSSATDRNGATPLHIAAPGGDVCIMKDLIKAGADVSRRDKFGRTPAYYARGNVEVLEMLEEAGDRDAELLRVEAINRRQVLQRTLDCGEYGRHDIFVENEISVGASRFSFRGRKKLRPRIKV